MHKISYILEKLTHTRKQSFQGVIDQLFDEVYVVSLPESLDRRKHIRKHFGEIGLTRYRFVDAFSSTSAEVAEAFAQNVVASYPACFRCKKLRCENDTCNNVLIAPQVANFLSYRALWERIAQQHQRALLVEDDVIFEANAKDTLLRLSQAIETGEVEFTPDKPRLLRLGWAQCKDHNADTPFQLDAVVRMSNPCHGITSAYARALLDRFTKIDTTSDIFIHQNAPENGEATTVFPPIASELSWSTGAIDSLIHPKSIRSKFLREQGREVEAIDNDRQVLTHIKHIHYSPLLILGHPGGTHSRLMGLLSRAGLQIGSDLKAHDGIMTWSLATDADHPNPPCSALRTRRALYWDHLLHPIERPEKVVPEILRFIRAHPDMYRFINNQILEMADVDLEKCTTEFEKAVLILVIWSDLIEQLRPTLTFRTEDKSADLIASLKRAGIEISPELQTMPPLTPPDATQHMPWESLSRQTSERLASYCSRYGYALPVHYSSEA